MRRERAECPWTDCFAISDYSPLHLFNISCSWYFCKQNTWEKHRYTGESNKTISSYWETTSQYGNFMALLARDICQSLSRMWSIFLYFSDLQSYWKAIVAQRSNHVEYNAVCPWKFQPHLGGIRRAHRWRFVEWSASLVICVFSFLEKLKTLKNS